MVKEYIPKQGDIIFTNFDPQIGKEQAGARPALVISISTYNQKAKLLVCCPITSQIKNYPFEVVLSKQQKTQGAILSDQIKNIDWIARPFYFIEKINPQSFQEVLAKIAVLLSLPE